MNIDEDLQNVELKILENCIDNYKSDSDFEGIFVPIWNGTFNFTAYGYYRIDDPEDDYRVKAIHYNGIYFNLNEDDIIQSKLVKITFEQILNAYNIASVMNVI